MRWIARRPHEICTALIALGLLLASGSEAQMGGTMGGPAGPGGSSIGIKGGFNLASFIGADAGDSESAVGLNAGGSFMLLSVGPVSIGPEVYYARKKSESTGLTVPGDGASVASEFDLAYVEVPLLVSVRLPRFGNDRFQPHLDAGPVFGWNLDCTVDLADQQASPEDTCASLLGGDTGSTLEDYEQGITFGGGLDFTVVPGRGALSLDLRTTLGLSDVIERESGEDLEIRNRTFSAMLGYSFGI